MSSQKKQFLRKPQVGGRRRAMIVIMEDVEKLPAGKPSLLGEWEGELPPAAVFFEKKTEKCSEGETKGPGVLPSLA